MKNWLKKPRPKRLPSPLKTTDRWSQFLNKLELATEVTLVGPFAALPPASAALAIYIDRGSRVQLQNPSHVSVGDGDSGTPLHTGDPTELDCLLPAEKDLSDLAYALAVIPQQVSKVILQGFLGGRRDHELIGFGEVHHFLRRRANLTECHFEDQISAFSSGEWAVAVSGTFSVVAFEETNLTLTGACKYQLPDLTTVSTISSQGLSNEGHGEIRITTNKPVFIFRN